MDTEREPGLRLLSTYADDRAEGRLERIRIGEGLIGQCAADAKRLLITDMPANVVPIRSRLFKIAPKNVIVLPVLFEGQVKAVIEIGSVSAFTDLQVSFLDQLTATIGIVFNSIEATMQTEGLLTQSQELATELQTRQKELQQTNEENRRLSNSPSAMWKSNVRTRRSSRPASRSKSRRSAAAEA